ncbi:uncharacterized protein LOC128958076 [Oppia nitens]|uniref:uncharacterized protein LOC128958076 n=1 Tax=Oppia nitens TaxID=1686743 RepID=UPI0023D9C340|nr:uncharacterized protein LOC128958076 [Oppia nitens]
MREFSILEIIAIVLVTKTSLKITLSVCRGLWTTYLANKLGFGVQWKPGDDVWAVVTGGTDGIGLEYCKQLAQKGYNLVIISRNEDKLMATKASIIDTYRCCRQIKIICVDFNRTDIYQKIAQELNQLNVIDVLVNNVGTLYKHPEYFMDIDPKMNDTYVNVNMLSYLKLSEIVLPKMIQQRRGIVINISSQTALFAIPLMTTYSATKAFNRFLSDGLSTEYKSKGVIIQTVMPSMTKTKLLTERNGNSWFTVSAHDFVRAALNTVGIENSTYGHWKHKLMSYIIESMIGFIGQRVLSEFTFYTLNKESFANICIKYLVFLLKIIYFYLNNNKTVIMLSNLEIVAIISITIIILKFVLSILRGIWTTYLGYRLGYGIQWKPGENVWAVVTGATDGIGLQYAKQLAQIGYNLTIISRNEDKLKTTKKMLTQTYVNCKLVKTITADFNRTDIYDDIETQLNQLAVIDVLVNNVGIVYHIPEYFVKIPSKFNETYINVNVMSALKMTQFVLPQMVQNKRGVIINVSSQASEIPFPLYATYSASKAFHTFLSDSLSIEYASKGIVIQTVVPNQVKTKLTTNVDMPLISVTPEDYVSAAIKTVGIENYTYGHWKHKLLAFLANLGISFIGRQNFSKMAFISTLNMRQIYYRNNNLDNDI